MSIGWSVTHSFDDPHVAPYWPTWPGSNVQISSFSLYPALFPNKTSSVFSYDVDSHRVSVGIHEIRRLPPPPTVRGAAVDGESDYETKEQSTRHHRWSRKDHQRQIRETKSDSCGENKPLQPYVKLVLLQVICICLFGFPIEY